MTSYEIDRRAAEMIEEYKKANCAYNCEEFVFEITYKFKGQSVGFGSYEPCTYQGNIDNFELNWFNDWWEGEDDVVFERVVPLYSIIYFYFERMDDPKKYDVCCLECRHFENCADAGKEGSFNCYTYEPRYKYLVNNAQRYKPGEGPELKFKFLDFEEDKDDV